MKIREDWLEMLWSMAGWGSAAFCVGGICLLTPLMLRGLFRDPVRDEGPAEYILPRAVVLFSLFCLAIAVMCVIGEYLPDEGLIR